MIVDVPFVRLDTPGEEVATGARGPSGVYVPGLTDVPFFVEE